MGNLARVILLLGVVLFVVALGVLGKNLIDVNQLHAVASANRSLSFFNPVWQVTLGSALALLSGVLLGLGVALLLEARRARNIVAEKQGGPGGHRGNVP